MAMRQNTLRVDYVAFFPNSFISFIFSRTFAPSSSTSIKLLTALSSSFALTIPLLPSSPSLFRANPTPKAFTNSKAFNTCSAYRGQAMMGTPNHMLSRVEFHPQCDTNPPTAECERMATWGAHFGQTSPRSHVLSTNPAVSTSSNSASRRAPKPGPSSLCRTRSDHRNRWPLSSRPRAIS
ncbi:hypothetical protein EJ110_NYTH09409 [Nymphaea thermarum]|nr:hypothetical protein EJ110_NYTH09409 [Nymphaea thermarum]